LVLSDVMMPNLDGLGLVRALRENPETRTLPVILLSARAGQEASLEGLAAGADDYLAKPFTSQELLARVRTHLTMARARDQLVKKERFDTGALVARICTELTTSDTGADADISIGSLPQTLADQTLLRQVWVNLISNALKYSSTRVRPRVQISGFDKGEESV